MKKPGKKEIKEALINNSGFIANSAQDLVISRQTLAKYIEADPDLQTIMKDAKEALKDEVEHQLLKNIKAGKETSIIWFMKTQMKDRGYIEKIENETNLNVNQVVIHYVIPEEQKKLDTQTVTISLPPSDENNS